MGSSELSLEQLQARVSSLFDRLSGGGDDSKKEKKHPGGKSSGKKAKRDRSSHRSRSRDRSRRETQRRSKRKSKSRRRSASNKKKRKSSPARKKSSRHRRDDRSSRPSKSKSKSRSRSKSKDKSEAKSAASSPSRKENPDGLAAHDGPSSVSAAQQADIHVEGPTDELQWRASHRRVQTASPATTAGGSSTTTDIFTFGPWRTRQKDADSDASLLRQGFDRQGEKGLLSAVASMWITGSHPSWPLTPAHPEPVRGLKGWCIESESPADGPRRCRAICFLEEDSSATTSSSQPLPSPVLGQWRPLRMRAEEDAMLILVEYQRAGLAASKRVANDAVRQTATGGVPASKSMPKLSRTPQADSKGSPGASPSSAAGSGGGSSLASLMARVSQLGGDLLSRDTPNDDDTAFVPSQPKAGLVPRVPPGGQASRHGASRAKEEDVAGKLASAPWRQGEAPAEETGGEDKEWWSEKAPEAVQKSPAAVHPGLMIPKPKVIGLRNPLANRAAQGGAALATHPYRSLAKAPAPLSRPSAVAMSTSSNASVDAAAGESSSSSRGPWESGSTKVYPPIGQKLAAPSAVPAKPAATPTPPWLAKSKPKPKTTFGGGPSANQYVIGASSPRPPRMIRPQQPKLPPPTSSHLKPSSASVDDHDASAQDFDPDAEQETSPHRVQRPTSKPEEEEEGHDEPSTTYEELGSVWSLLRS